MLKRTLIVLLLAFYNISIAQLDNNLKAKLYFTEAEKTYKQGDFDSSLKYIRKAESTLGTTVPRILALKIKVFYAQGEFIMAKKHIDNYTSSYMQNASKELNDGVLELYVNIEEAAEKQQNQRLKNKEKEKEKALIEYFSSPKNVANFLNKNITRAGLNFLSKNEYYIKNVGKIIAKENSIQFFSRGNKLFCRLVIVDFERNCFINKREIEIDKFSSGSSNERFDLRFKLDHNCPPKSAIKILHLYINRKYKAGGLVNNLLTEKIGTK